MPAGPGLLHGYQATQSEVTEDEEITETKAGILSWFREFANEVLLELAMDLIHSQAATSFICTCVVLVQCQA